jgi:hypothetical protein
MTNAMGNNLVYDPIRSCSSIRLLTDVPHWMNITKQPISSYIDR